MSFGLHVIVMMGTFYAFGHVLGLALSSNQMVVSNTSVLFAQHKQPHGCAPVGMHVFICTKYHGNKWKWLFFPYPKYVVCDIHIKSISNQPSKQVICIALLVMISASTHASLTNPAWILRFCSP